MGGREGKAEPDSCLLKSARGDEASDLITGVAKAQTLRCVFNKRPQRQLCPFSFLHSESLARTSASRCHMIEAYSGKAVNTAFGIRKKTYFFKLEKMLFVLLVLER